MTRTLAIVWALWWALVFYTGLIDTDVGLPTKLMGLVFIAVMGLGPLMAHVWWSRRHQEAAPTAHAGGASLGPPAAHQPNSPLGRLERITEAAAHLRDQGWITRSDHRAIIDRVTRLTDLTLADQQSVTLGGRTSPVVIEEIHELHTRVLALLDAGIDSAAIEPGDAGLDARLQHHIDVIRSRGQAIGELEGRQQPGT